MTKIQRQSDRSRVWVAPFIQPEQEDAIVRMLWEFNEENPDATFGVVNGSNMDTGKTLQAAEVVVRAEYSRVLYIGVKDTFDQWRDRLAEQSDGAIQLRRLDSSDPGQAAWKDAIVDCKPGHYFTGSQYIVAQDWETRPVLNPTTGKQDFERDKHGDVILDKDGQASLATKQHQRKIFKRAKITANHFELIVFDEAHVVANRTSVGRQTIRTIPRKRLLAMSGTWLGNKFINAHAMTRMVWPEIIESNLTTWTNQYCQSKAVLKPDGTPLLGRHDIPVRKVGAEREEGAFVATLPCYIRIDGELEVPEPEIVLVDLLPQQRADYDDLERDLMVWLATSAGQRASLVADLPITLRARLRTATLGVMTIDHDTDEIFFADDTLSTKLHALRGIVDRPDWTGKQVGIYLSSKRFAKVVVKRMRAAGYNAVEWSGDVNSADRTKIKTAFLNGEIQYLVSTIQSFSTGLDGFQTVCNRVIWMEESDNNMLNQQAIKRYFRRGRADGFQHVKIVARDTYDQGILSSNVEATLAMHASLALAA